MSTNTAESKEGSELHILLGDTNQAPYLSNAPGDILATFNAAVLGQLIKTNKNFDLMPGHLESWGWDFEKSEYVLTLKKGLKFHNGRAVTAGDLEFSLLRGFFSKQQSFYRTYLSNIQGVDAIVPGSKFKRGLVSGIVVVNDQVLRVKLSHPNPSFLLGLTGPYFSLVPAEEMEDDYLTWKKIPIGVGPYRVAKPFNEGVTQLHSTSPDGRTLSTVYLYTTQKNRIYDVSIYASDQLDTAKYKKEVSSIADAVFNLSFSNVNPIAKKPEFRKFMALALSKELICTGADDLKPVEELLPAHLWGRANIASKYNLDEARKLLNGPLASLKTEGIHLSVFSGPNLSKQKAHLIKGIQQAMKVLGVNLTYETSLNKFATTTEASKASLFLSGMIADYIDPLVMFASMTMRGADKNTRSVNDETLEKLYLDASKNAQRETRIKALQELSKYVIDQNYTIALAESHLIYYINPNTVRSVGEQPQPIILLIENIERR